MEDSGQKSIPDRGVVGGGNQGSIKDMLPAPREFRFNGVHCNLLLEHFPGQIAVLRINGTDIGEFGEAPMKTLEDWIAGSGPVDLFIDARDVRGASIDVSGVWAGWLSSNRKGLNSVTMLTGSRFIEITAEFVRRFARLEGIMRVCNEPAVFDEALGATLRMR
jgi:hypothetical protein